MAKDVEKIILNAGSGYSEIRVGEDWKNVTQFLPSDNVVIITDDNIRSLYGNDFPSFPVLTVAPGETSKTLSVIGDLAGKMLDLGIDRSGFVAAIGGGVVCDIAGLLASVYMRGIRCGYVSTTLLSQVDASTGGKNGVDHAGAKNIIGTIRQPEFVICDPSMLSTLPEEEYLSGLAELIKTAVIGDKSLFSMLETHSEDVRKRNPRLLEIMIAGAVRFKAAVVTEDEREKGLRRILNYGHTFGHALEMKLSMKHGFAVACGMELAAMLSVEKGLATPDDAGRIVRILRDFNLLSPCHADAEEIGKLIRFDKKKSGDQIDFVFNSGIGKAVYSKVPVEELTGFYRKYTESKKSEK